MERLLGKRIKRDVDNHEGLTLIPAGTVIEHAHLGLLVSHSIDTESIIIVPETEEQCRQAVKQIVNASKELFHSIGFTKKIPVMEIRQEILPVIQQVSRHANVFELFQAVKATDEYTYQHNIGVGVLSTLIGRWMNLQEKDLATLSLAATLHDVGKVKVPIEILNKPGKLSDDEYEQIKKHTIIGYELLKGTIGLHHRIPLVALQHHERGDGRGYPLGLISDQIDLFSKIVSVADIFHAMTSKRPYHEPVPLQEILGQMRNGIFGELDPHIVSVFLNHIVNKWIGENVVLNDGRRGKVVYLNPHRLDAPLIKVNDEFIDLSQTKTLHIQEVSV